MIELRLCARCGKQCRADRMVKGFGSDCAEQLGLVGDAPDVGQNGPDLFDAYAEDDACDGWDRPADRPQAALSALVSLWTVALV